MMIGILPAFEAVTSAVSLLDGVTSTTGRSVTQRAQAAGAAKGVDFAQVLSQVATDAVDQMKAGEQAAISGLQGKASVQQVVEAMMNAERSLQTAIALRDKITNAYQEISRMAI